MEELQEQPAACCSGTGAKSKNGCKQKRKDKDNRSAEKVLKTLNDVPSGLKLGVLANKYTELDERHKNCEVASQNLGRQCTLLTREKEQLKAENGRLILARTQLEGLCRELYRLNKIIKEDSVARLREEEERRKEITSRFETTLSEVTNMMQENFVKHEKLHDANITMANKMKVLYDNFEGRKDEQDKVDKQLQLERQVTELKVQKVKLQVQAERALWNEERTSLTEKWKSSEKTCSELQVLVDELHKRMETYEERHLGYKSAIDNNSKFFENCKTEIRGMNGKVVLLEKEIIIWKERAQQNELKAMEISALKQAQDAQLATALRRVESLQSLCRQLQDDRSSYLKLLQAKGIDPDSKVESVTEGIPMFDKEQLLIPIWHQLNYVKLHFTTKKDQLTINTLETLIADSKSKDELFSAMNLILGFINFKSTSSKSNEPYTFSILLPRGIIASAGMHESTDNLSSLNSS